MSYKVASTTSQGCECELFIRLWANVFNFLGKGFIDFLVEKNRELYPTFSTRIFE